MCIEKKKCSFDLIFFDVNDLYLVMLHQFFWILCLISTNIFAYEDNYEYHEESMSTPGSEQSTNPGSDDGSKDFNSTDDEYDYGDYDGNDDEYNADYLNELYKEETSTLKEDPDPDNASYDEEYYDDEAIEKSDKSTTIQGKGNSYV